MRGVWRRWPVLAAAALAACLGLDPSPGVNLQWDVVESGVAQSVSAVGGRASVVVRGHIPTSLPCNPLAADVRQSGSTVRLTVTLIEGRNFCVGKPSLFHYVANVVNLKSGSRTLIVEHRFENVDRPPEIVLEEGVTIS